MKVNQYDPHDQTETLDVSSVDFGTVIKGKHNDEAIVLQPDWEAETPISLAMFLESDDGLSHSQFGKFKSSSFISDVLPGSSYLSDHFVPITGIQTSDISTYSDFGLVLNAATPEYVWVDAEAGFSETAGSASINLRFVFEYT